MLSSLKNLIKWSPRKTQTENKTVPKSILLHASVGLIEDALFWRNTLLSLSCIVFINIVFLISVHQQVNLVQFVVGVSAVIISIDAFESWLKYKHRTACLKRFINNDGSQLKIAADKINYWLKKKWSHFVYIRHTDPTQAYILVNVVLSILALLGYFINGYLLMYLICIFLSVAYKITPTLKTFVRKVNQAADSDTELEDLIPDVSEADIKLLSIEPEPVHDDKQSLDYWKPDDMLIEEASDSSENSNSIITSLSMEKMQTFDKDAETSDSSEEEYMPMDHQNDQLQSTLEIQPQSSWSSSAYNALFNMAGAVTNMVYTGQGVQRKRISSIDSSDGFEMIDKNDVM